jgi:hypothetical protein
MMVMEIIMSAMPKLLANNYNGNERSILLLFNEFDAKTSEAGEMLPRDTIGSMVRLARR